MNDPVQKDIDDIHQKLRSIDDELGHLGVQRGPKRRFPGDHRGANGVPLGRKPITFNEHPSFAKRRRGDSARDDAEDDEMEDERPRRTVQSTVVMPVIDTKSREEKIEELVKTEKKEVANRNRRMFSNLLMGTLSKFKKDENKGVAERKQAEKLVEVEKKLQEIKRQDKEKVIQERQALMDQRREKERELRQLTRKKALIQYAEVKKTHYRLLSNYIQTQTKPVIFYLPAKHTVRSLEMLKNSEKAIEGLIELREKELQRELDHSHEHSDGEGETIKSFVSKGKGSEKRKRERRESHNSSESEDEKPAEEEHKEKEEHKEEEEAEEENLPEVVEDGGDDEETKE